EKIEKLSDNIILSSLCGLGKSGPNPIMSTLRYFKDEYISHIKDKKCPAGVCRDLITYEILDNCTGCTACKPVCPVNAITGNKKELHVIDQNLCTQCGACFAVCNFDAILVS
ncbi:MAG: 4Fe-4S binding protein, partial [candidate division Zixibacteria bacterium]|nr:4Fe-4S binding protein [candidate division Zixibacteria bacterium]